MSRIVKTGSFTATGATTDAFGPDGDFNVTLTGTFVGTVQPERSLDSGATWSPFTYIDGSSLTWTTAMSTTMSEPEDTVLWRLNCTAYTSGTISWRLSQ